MFKKDIKIEKEPESKSTTNLMKELLEASSFDSFNETNETYYVDFVSYFKQILKSKKLKVKQIAIGANLNQKYTYQFINGTRPISRDKVIMLAFGCRLNLEETQSLLKSASKSPLYPKIKRDSVIILAISRCLSIMDTNDLLYEFNESLLE